MLLDCFWNVMAHAHKPDFVFRAKRMGPFKSAEGASVQSTTGSRGVHISGSNAGYTMFRGSVKSTGYPLHSPVSPFTSPPVRHRVPSHFNWIRLQCRWYKHSCNIWGYRRRTDEFSSPLVYFISVLLFCLEDGSIKYFRNLSVIYKSMQSRIAGHWILIRISINKFKYENNLTNFPMM